MNAEQDWLNELYKQAFPHLETIKENRDITSQFQGVDKWFYCRNTKPYKIEEKFRTENYNDILLEDYSNWTTRRPGWARDSQKTTDFLAYIFLPKKTLWIFWYPPLRQYFLTNYDTLYRKYVTESRERDYKWGETFGSTGELLFRTANIPVPLAEFPRPWLAKNFWQYHT